MTTALVPTNMSELTQYVETFARGTGIMCGTNDPEVAKIILLTSLHEGLSPLDYHRKYHTIKGKPAKRYDRMLVEFREMGGTYSIKDCCPERVEIEFKTPDGEVYKKAWTWEEAKQSRWPWADKERTTLKDNWSTPEDRETAMFARLVSKWMRRLAPEICAGIYTPEEVEDFDDGEPATSPPSASEMREAVISAHVSDPGTATPDQPATPVAETTETFAPAEEPVRDEPAMISKDQLARIDQLTKSIEWTQDLIDKFRAAAKGQPKEEWSFDLAKVMIERLEALAGN